eukprot:1147377-Pelagomonas_calceolata.AAC.1
MSHTQDHRQVSHFPLLQLANIVSVLKRLSMKLQSKLGALVSVKTKLFKRLKSVGAVDDPAHTLQNGMERDLS